MSQFGLGFVGGIRSPPTSLSFHNSATSTTSGTITYPASMLAGDLIVLHEWADGGTPANVVMTGFTDVWNRQDATIGTDNRWKCSIKVATGAESGAALTCLGGTTARKIMLVFRPNYPILTATASAELQVVQTTDPTAQNVLAGAGSVPLVVIGQYGVTGFGTVDPRTMSPAKDGEVQVGGSGNNWWLAYKIYNSSPANVSVDMADEGSPNFLTGFFIEVT